MLKFGDKFWFGIVWPPVILIVLLLLPYIDRNPSRRFKDRKIALIGATIALLGMGYLSVAGLPGYGIQQTAGSELTTEYVPVEGEGIDRKSTRLNSSHANISYAVFCLKKKKKKKKQHEKHIIDNRKL